MITEDDVLVGEDFMANKIILRCKSNINLDFYIPSESIDVFIDNRLWFIKQYIKWANRELRKGLNRYFIEED